MEAVTPVRQALYQLPHFKTRIPATRKLSIEEEGIDQADFKIFSDSSGQEERIEAVVIYKKGRSAPLRHLKAHLGPSTKHNTYEGEAVGGLLANWLIWCIPGTSFRSVSVYIDNQPLIKVAVKTGAWSGQHLVWAFADMLDNLRAKVTIQWISSHSEVKGNEETNRLAKEAAAGKASRQEDLPPLLCKTLPTSASHEAGVCQAAEDEVEEHVANLSKMPKVQVNQQSLFLHKILQASRATLKRAGQSADAGMQWTHTAKLFPLQNRQVGHEVLPSLR